MHTRHRCRMGLVLFHGHQCKVLLATKKKGTRGIISLEHGIKKADRNESKGTLRSHVSLVIAYSCMAPARWLVLDTPDTAKLLTVSRESGVIIPRRLTRRCGAPVKRTSRIVCRPRLMRACLGNASAGDPSRNPPSPYPSNAALGISITTTTGMWDCEGLFDRSRAFHPSLRLILGCCEFRHVPITCPLA
ncbi:hypothetical protein LZ32DRAFT_31610 [Colletotrichum eremochloae]|nr:hypothetical protein LZ32DRAFT_31610 [Colletotrichum eremochloae]